MMEGTTLLSPNLMLEDMSSSSIKIPFNNDHISDKNLSGSENENEISFSRIRTKVKQISASDSDTEKENSPNEVKPTSSPRNNSSDGDSNKVTYKKKSRIRNISNSDSESQSEHGESTNSYDLTRTKIKNKKLHDKFKQLKKPVKSISIQNKDEHFENSDGEKSDNESGNSLNEETSCLKIKQKLQKKSNQSLAAICDPDTSDEESAITIKQKSKPQSTKPTSPKAVRMSAKQAMENMQKIKSESNRMLREKEVSLPYHRPKALTLKDIMSRRRPAVTSDGKSLPIKMNSEQLQQYASLLEQRQKEMMELCKSDTDNEDENDSEEAATANNDLIVSSIATNNPEETNGTEVKKSEENCVDISDVNDKTFDDVCMEQNLNESKSNKLEMQNTDEQMIVDGVKNEVEKCNSNVATATDVLSDSEEKTIREDGSVQCEQGTEEESQVILLHYDTDKTEVMDAEIDKDKCPGNKVEKEKEIVDDKENLSDEFSDNDFTVEDLDRIIETAELNKDTSTKPLPHNNIEVTLGMKPKLTGAPGMVIDLDDDGSSSQAKLTGVELLKERFKYFANLKSLEDKENDREKKFKPGIQHLKLKQELEEQIAEQRSLEWEKRIEEENKLKTEMNEIGSVEGFDGEDIEKIEAKLEENDNVDEQEEESSSEEEIENDLDMTEKPRKRNPMVDDEAEVSEDDIGDNAVSNDGADDNSDQNGNDAVESDSESEDDESSDSEQEYEETKPRKGRILKAFEDSDDEETKVESTEDTSKCVTQDIRESQDDDIQLAQLQKSYSEDLFTSQECSQKLLISADKPKSLQPDNSLENDLGTQTFSILDTGNNTNILNDNCPEKLDVICGTQPCNENFDALIGMCTGNFVENLVTPQAPSSQLSQSQEMGDEVVALCTGKFYDNPLVSQSELANDNDENISADDSMNENYSQTTQVNIQSQTDNIQIDNTADKSTIGSVSVTIPENQIAGVNISKQQEVIPGKVNEGENKLLKSILDELDDPEFDSPKPKKYFFNNGGNKKTEQTKSVENSQLKKKFVIESDEETNDIVEVAGKKKKLKKRKLEHRALQISDEEDDESEQEEETYESDIEEDNERLIEYDSEENEVEIQAKPVKKKRIGKDFFEQEAELTSEDEWIGSGDEDEAGLDRMEREAGDDDTFHQGKLQRELGEIHMREVLDQDKREVRLLQELLFEDGDLGDGHRQRKFRWKNADGEEETGTNADEYADTQEDEFESEEQWRKQRHEREMFLRKLQEQDEEDANISINRSALIKANLSSKTTPIAADKVPNSIEKSKVIENEKKAANDVPSPKKPFTIFQQSYHNSLLTRGRGALARLAALATPLAGDGDDAPKVNASSTRGNFVFTAITPDKTEPKITKRKADANPDTPRLSKKMRKQDSNKKNSKISLLDHL